MEDQNFKIWCNAKTDYISDMGLLNGLRKIGYGKETMSIHCFLSMASTILNEQVALRNMLQTQTYLLINPPVLDSSDICNYTISMADISWAREGIVFVCDAQKRLEGLQKHGVDFLDASTAFFDPEVRTYARQR